MHNNYPMVEVDTHTHTILSGHAWSTLTENVHAAKERGMKGLCLTEHGPALLSGAPEFIPHSQRMIPDFVDGVRVYKGTEANILNAKGELDIPDRFLHVTEFVIASFHHIGGDGIEIGNSDENTEAYIRLMEDPWVDVIGHPDEPKVPCDLEALVLAAKKNGKLCELNNNRVASGIYASPRMMEYAQLCKKHDQFVCIGTDAHFHTMVGNIAAMLEMLASIDFPPELIINRKIEDFEAYIERRKNRIDEAEKKIEQ